MQKSIIGIDFETEHGLESISYNPYPVSLEGFQYDLTQQSITLKENRLTINLSTFPEAIAEHMKAFLSHLLVGFAEWTVLGFIKDISYNIKIDSNSSEDIESQIKSVFKEVVESTKLAPEQKSKLRSFYRWCAMEGMPYFDEDFVDFYLDEVRFGSNPNKGLDVIIDMKDRGALKIYERRIFNEGLKKVRVEELSLLELQGYISLRIGQHLGIRDIQARKLKVKHFGQSEKETFYLDIPRAKQRGKGKNKKTIRRPITPALAREIQHLINEIKSYGVKDISDHFLIFPVTRHAKSIRNEIILSGGFRNRVNKVVADVLELDFKITLRRLRKTFCSKLVAEGRPLKIIAALMDHSDLQQLQFYYRQTREIALKIDKVLKAEASEILDAFSGKVIRNGEESNVGQEIFAPVKDAKLHLIGSCASDQPCSLNPPLSCYSCPALEAFKDADHAQVLSTLTSNAKEVFGEAHAIELLQHKDYLAASALVNKLEECEYE